MKIDGKENVNIIRLEHQGYDLRFQRMSDIPYYTDFNPLEIEPSRCVTIEFADTLEIDRLISMLQRLRDGCVSKAGRYKLVKEE